MTLAEIAVAEQPHDGAWHDRLLAQSVTRVYGVTVVIVVLADRSSVALYQAHAEALPAIGGQS